MSRIAQAISRGERNRIRRRRVERLLRSAFLSGDFDVPDKISAAMLAKLRAGGAR